MQSKFMSNSTIILNKGSTMKNPIIFIVVSIVALLNISSAYAGMSEVKWKNTEKYNDIRAGNEHQKHFEERIFGAFEKHFLKLSEQLPKGQLLQIKVLMLI